MQIYKSFVDSPVTKNHLPCAFTFGTFDGLHLGHAFILHKLISKAKEKGLPAVVLTFSNHPREVLPSRDVPLCLTSSVQKLDLIEHFGFDIVLELSFTQELASYSSEEFFQRVALMFPLKVFIAGEDVGFGKDRKGNQEFLEKKAQQLYFDLEIVEKFKVDGVSVSSSKIRELLYIGDFTKAALFLGRPYVLQLPLREICANSTLCVDASKFARPKEGDWQAKIRFLESPIWHTADVHVDGQGQLQICPKDLRKESFFESAQKNRVVEIQFCDEK
jgi:cytidyltransferase-like protein